MLLAFSIPVVAAEPASRHFAASDGARLHFLEAGEGQALVFVPGWTMPADIWEPQIRHFAQRYRVIAFDPRGQGLSEVARDGYSLDRRARDIGELLDRLGEAPVVLVGWSLAVLEALTYVERHGTQRLRALVLVDNSIGEGSPPVSDGTFLARLRRDREAAVSRFVRGMFRTPQPETYYRHLVSSALRMPLANALQLLQIRVPREAWSRIARGVDRPLLYVVNPRFRDQALALKEHRPAAWTEVFEEAGHALFVDEPGRFNRLLEDFLLKEVSRGPAAQR